MSKNIVITNAILRGFGRNKSGGHAKFAATLTLKISQAFGWEEIPETFKGGTPDNSELNATKIEMTPNNSELKGRAMSLDCQHVGSFQIVKLKVKKGENSVRSKQRETELQFTVDFADPNGCMKLEQYMLGAARSKMVLYYDPSPEQAELPGVVATDEQRQAVLGEEG